MEITLHLYRFYIYTSIMCCLNVIYIVNPSQKQSMFSVPELRTENLGSEEKKNRANSELRNVRQICAVKKQT